MRRDSHSMKMLTPNEMLELRTTIVTLNLPDERQDELIRLIDNIIVSIIDQEFGWSPVQTSLSVRANRVFSASDSCSGLPQSGRFAKVRTEEEGATQPEQSTDHPEP